MYMFKKSPFVKEIPQEREKGYPLPAILFLAMIILAVGIDEEILCIIELAIGNGG